MDMYQRIYGKPLDLSKTVNPPPPPHTHTHTHTPLPAAASLLPARRGCGRGGEKGAGAGAGVVCGTDALRRCACAAPATVACAYGWCRPPAAVGCCQAAALLNHGQRAPGLVSASSLGPPARVRLSYGAGIGWAGWGWQMVSLSGDDE